MQVSGDVWADVFAECGLPEAERVQIVNDNGEPLFTLTRSQLKKLVVDCVSAALALRSAMGGTP